MGVDSRVEEDDPKLIPLSAPNHNLFRATFSPYPSFRRKTSLSAVPEGSTAPDQEGHKGLKNGANYQTEGSVGSC